MKSSNKDKIAYSIAVVMATAFLALVTYSIAVNFDVFKTNTDSQDSTEKPDSVLPKFGSLDVTKENQDRKIIIKSNSVSFPEEYIVLRKGNANEDERINCVNLENDCLFYELQDIDTGTSYYLSDTSPLELSEKPNFAVDKSGTIEIDNKEIDVTNEVVITVPDDPDSEGPNLDLAEEKIQEIYGCIPSSAVCFSSGLITLEENEKQVAQFQNFLNNLKYE